MIKERDEHEMIIYMNECVICKRIQRIREGKNPYFVKELETGYVVLGDFQCYKGYTVFLSKTHVEELHELEEQVKIKFLEEMAQVAEAVYKAFHPVKLNYELLGNRVPHLHWHIFPRYKSDPNIKSPVWEVDKSIRCAQSTKPTEVQLEKMKNQLLKDL